MVYTKMVIFQSHFWDVLKLLQGKKKRHRGHLVSLPTVALSYTLAFVMSLKILSSINGAVAIHKKFQGEKKKLARKGLQSEDYRSRIQTQIQEAA